MYRFAEGTAILSGDVRDDDSDDGGTEYMIIMWNRETMI
jgi:hypothetical protein